MSAAYKFTVEDVVHVAGKGWLHTGKIESAYEPALGKAYVFGDGSIGNSLVTVIAFEKFAIPNWWRHAIGVLLAGGTKLPIGTVLRGDAK
jgi:hypothetical protein